MKIKLSLNYREAFMLEPGMSLDVEFPAGFAQDVLNHTATQRYVLAVDERGHLNICRLKTVQDQGKPLRIAIDPWADAVRSLR